MLHGFSLRRCDEILHALCKFHHFAASLEFELNFIISGRCVINRLSQAHKRLYHLARQNEADPYAEKESNRRHNG